MTPNVEGEISKAESVSDFRQIISKINHAAHYRKDTKDAEESVIARMKKVITDAASIKEISEMFINPAAQQKCFE